jgi:hypothetical protein
MREAATTARRFPHSWSGEELDACYVAVQDTTDTSEWIGSVVLFAFAVLIILAFGFL